MYIYINSYALKDTRVNMHIHSTDSHISALCLLYMINSSFFGMDTESLRFEHMLVLYKNDTRTPKEHIRVHVCKYYHLPRARSRSRTAQGSLSLCSASSLYYVFFQQKVFNHLNRSGSFVFFETLSFQRHYCHMCLVSRRCSCTSAEYILSYCLVLYLSFRMCLVSRRCSINRGCSLRLLKGTVAFLNDHRHVCLADTRCSYTRTEDVLLNCVKDTLSLLSHP